MGERERGLKEDDRTSNGGEGRRERELKDSTMKVMVIQ
jgi:hypothetical protein